MGEEENTINRKTIIPLSRNTPVALVVGVAGFLGSHLADRLAEKNIQMVGVDDLSTGRKENLEEVIKQKNFHFMVSSAQGLDLDLPRLDYIFISTVGGWDIATILKLFKEWRSKLVLISNIDLYDKSKKNEEYKWFEETEVKLAKFAKDHNLNARVLRIGPIFGPRMHFREKDPIIRLIQASLTDQLQKEAPLEFSTRALYVADACDLAIKCILAGATAQKIFDGSLPTPVKVQEVKQILLDPVWYDSYGFTPSELPPWPTPNLDKTQKFLNWKPRTNLVEALRETISYFRDREIGVPKLEVEEIIIEDKSQQKWKEEKIGDLEGFKKKTQPAEIKERKRISLPRWKIPVGKTYFILGILLIGYGLLWPMVRLGWGVLTFRYQLALALENLQQGEFNKSLENIDQADGGAIEAKAIYRSVEPLRNLVIFKNQFELGDDLSNLANLSLGGAKATVLGAEALYKGLKTVTFESQEDPFTHFSKAQLELIFADEQISKALILLEEEQLLKRVPTILKGRVENLKKRLLSYSDFIKKGKIASLLLPAIVAKEGGYLVVLQNNMELRPTGGFIGSLATLDFSGGRLKKLEVNDIYAIDGALKIHVEPPKEIKEDLGQKDWFLRDSNFEPDFPTSAKQAEWFFTKETGQKIFGVLALDISAISDLLSVIGSLDLPDYDETINQDNLFEKAVAYSEQGFFPGSQAKKNFLTSLSLQLFNKIFFLPNQNWPGIVSSLSRSLEEKHMTIFLDDPKLFSYVLSQNWAGSLPRASKETDSLKDFLAPVEANLGANKANYYLDRAYNLETVFGKDGEVNHRLKITYINKSPSETFPAGKYKNRFRLYLPFGAKLTRVAWGGSEITKDVSAFVDYGRAGYSMLLEILPKQQKDLVLDYQLPLKLEFKEGKATYRLDIIKQAGTLKDPFEWRLSFPINYKLENQEGKIAPQEQIIQTDLSRDRSFEVVFKR